MIISKKSWHYKMVTEWNDKTNSQVINMDSCQYIRSLIWAFVWLFLACFLGFVAIVLVADTIAWFVAGLITSFVMPSDAAAAMLIVLFVVAGGYCWLLYAMHRRNREYDVPKRPSFVAQTYDRVKNKFCSKIEVV